MGIFSNQPNGDAAAPRRRSDSNTVSIIAPDLLINGDLQAEGVIRIEGRVAGNVSAGNQILLSQGGVVEGDLATREAVLAGEVRGTVVASERIEVQASAQVHGDIVTPRLLIQEGGLINGAIRMETPGGPSSE
ncbi:MAG: polymer-forming cytoskeletal protein [Gemmatimonadales bacterium]